MAGTTEIPHPDGRQDSKLALSALTVLMGVGVLGILLYSLQAASLAKAFTIIGVGVLTGAAAMLAGAVLGFLFGIPRTLQAESEGQSGTGYRANTNLEQISDWLTKILVGVGLTQLAQVPEMLQRVADFILKDIRGFSGAQAFVISILLFYAFCGFLFGFLWTRLFLGGALRTADMALLGQVQEAKEKVEKALDTLKEQSELDALALNLVARQLSRDTPPVPLEELTKAIALVSPLVRDQIFNQAKTVRKNNWRSNKVVMGLAEPVFRALIASDPHSDRYEYHGQLGFVLKDKEPPALLEAKQELTRAIQIRGAWEKNGYLFYEFNRALCNINMDPNFDIDKESSPQARAEIEADLIAFFWVDELREAFLEIPEAGQWVQLNHCDPDALIEKGQDKTELWE